jgi:hypothetical protein
MKTQFQSLFEKKDRQIQRRRTRNTEGTKKD